MRRLVALVAAMLLVASLTGSSLAAAGGPKSSSLSGSFDLLTGDDPPVLLGHAIVQLFEPTEQRLVPGSYDFIGAAGNPILESHAQIGQTHFGFAAEHWAIGAAYPGANIAIGEGVECVYYGPNETDCHGFAVEFIDPLDPAGRHEAVFANQKDEDGNWMFEYWQTVGTGNFSLRFSGIES